MACIPNSRNIRCLDTTVRNQRAMNTGAQRVFVALVIQSAGCPVGRYCPLMANVSLLQLVQSRSSLTHTCPVACFLGDVRCCEADNIVHCSHSSTEWVLRVYCDFSTEVLFTSLPHLTSLEVVWNYQNSKRYYPEMAIDPVSSSIWR